MNNSRERKGEYKAFCEGIPEVSDFVEACLQFPKDLLRGTSFGHTCLLEEMKQRFTVWAEIAGLQSAAQRISTLKIKLTIPLVDDMYFKGVACQKPK